MFSIFSSPSFWLCISFVLFVVVLVRPIVGLIITSLDYQRGLISEELDSSKQIRERAESFLEDARNQRIIAKQDSERIISNALEEGKRLNDDYRKKLEEFLLNEEKRTEISISRLEKDSINRLQDQVFDISFHFAKQILLDFSVKSQNFRSSVDKDVLNKLKNFKL
jgi:F0F1-type ATP synthase membrane subunit b/b'